MPPRAYLPEALERYGVDGLFFNMFGNQSTDYSGNPVGNCHCDNCKRRFRETFSRELPEAPDEDYRAFMYECSREVAAEFGRLIHTKRPGAGYFNYLQVVHRWNHERIEHGRAAATAVLAVYVQRQREPRSQ